jgi:aerobic carbon-monoxide dehydrogenase medium subunit
MHAFQYHRADDSQHAAQLVQSASDGKLLAGGQSLLPSMRLRLATPSDLVDLASAKDLRGVHVEAGRIVIGSMTRHAEVASHGDVLKHIPALAQLAGGIGDRQVRNLGTLGGSLANDDPSACYPAAALGLGAVIHTQRRTINADDFFKGLFETALAAHEVITAVAFPVPTKAAYVKFKQPASRFALVGVFVSQGPAGIRVAVTGAGQSGVFRATAIEAVLAKSWTPEAVKAVKVEADGLLSDIHAQADYRAHLISVLAARAITAME